ncbi:hypothetical protein ACQ4M4_23065 [Leptolyngbya sp. AN02str]|uniref:hypothetical protein n=1 Tax=Leptolyngbya sp. AN02str TaxID=3423363 RepID=UPI003D31D12E
MYEYHYENEADKLGSKLGGYPDLHGTVPDIEDAATGRLLMELQFGDDYLFWFIEDQNLINRDFSQIEFYYESD